MDLWGNQHRHVNPDLVILAREARGLAQDALASELGVTQGRISKIEAGLLPVPDDLLAELARALHYPPHFFTQSGTVLGIGISEVFHRKRQDVSKKVLNRIYAEIEVRVRHISALLRSVNIPCSIPRLDIDEYGGRADEIARLTRAALQAPRGPVQDLTQTLEDAGAIIVPFDFGTPKVDAISRWLPGLPPLIFVNNKSPKDRYRLSVAHELGHLVMHTYAHADMEEQAFRFADEFLMPEREIAHELEDVNLAQLTILKRYWKVSMAALLMHAERLHAVRPTRARYLWALMNKHGYKVREPVELDIDGEVPHLLHELIDAHRNDLGYSTADLAELLALFDDELLEQYIDDGAQPGLRLVHP